MNWTDSLYLWTETPDSVTIGHGCELSSNVAIFTCIEDWCLKRGENKKYVPVKEDIQIHIKLRII